MSDLRFVSVLLLLLALAMAGSCYPLRGGDDDDSAGDDDTVGDDDSAGDDDTSGDDDSAGDDDSTGDDDSSPGDDDSSPGDDDSSPGDDDSSPGDDDSSPGDDDSSPAGDDDTTGSSCGTIGQLCSAILPCDSGQNCYNPSGPPGSSGVCAVARSTCLGFAGAQCNDPQAPHCMRLANTTIGICASTAEFNCICSGPGASLIDSSVCPPLPPPPVPF